MLISYSEQNEMIDLFNAVLSDAPLKLEEHIFYLNAFLLTLALYKHRLSSRTKFVYNQTQSSAHPCVPRPKLQGLDGISSALQSGVCPEMV